MKKDQYRQAMQLFADSQFEAAHQICMSILSDDPRYADAYYLLALIAAAFKNYGKAIDVLDRAIAFDEEGRPAYLAEKAKCFLALNRHELARSSIEQCADMSNHTAITLDTVGVVLSRLGEHERAITFFERAVNLDDKQAEIYYNMGASLQFLGRFVEAAEAYEQAITLQPDMVKAHSALSQLSKQTAEQNHIRRLTDLWEVIDGIDERLHVGHALAKEYEDLEDYDNAFRFLCLAKEKKRAAVNYQIDAATSLFTAARQGYEAIAAGKNEPSDEPIFVVGMPRTGTTLVERIVSSHSRVSSAGELPDMSLVTKRLTNTPSPLVLDAATLDAAAQVDMAELGKAYIDSTRPRTGECAHFVDKMPFNFFYAGIIARALPNAKIIALVRNPMDTCLSNFRQLFSTRFPYYDYAYSIDDTAQFYGLFRSLVDYWQLALGDHFLSVSYESLIEEPEKQTRRLLSFCRLDFEEACLSFHRNSAPVSTASSVQVRQPLYRTAVDRWRRYGDNLKPLQQALTKQGFPI